MAATTRPASSGKGVGQDTYAYTMECHSRTFVGKGRLLQLLNRFLLVPFPRPSVLIVQLQLCKA